MIKAAELRVGNLIEIIDSIHGNGIEPVESILGDFNFMEASEISTVKYKGFPCGYCNPIPLSEEWLLKFGFKYEEWKQFSENLNTKIDGLACGYVINRTYCFLIYKNELKWFGGRNTRSWKEGDDWWNFTQYGSPEYVHQLQNLYFALTGKELTIKE